MADSLHNRLNQEGPSPTTSANLCENRYMSSSIDKIFRKKDRQKEDS
jgi:hypothetical protein